jgi:hypothetical protein
VGGGIGDFTYQIILQSIFMTKKYKVFPWFPYLSLACEDGDGQANCSSDANSNQYNSSVMETEIEIKT